MLFCYIWYLERLGLEVAFNEIFLFFIPRYPVITRFLFDEKIFSGPDSGHRR